jgi:hypothetical protein
MKLALLPVLFAVGMSSMAQAQSSIDRPKVVIDAVELKETLLPEAVHSIPAAGPGSDSPVPPVTQVGRRT